MPLTLHIDAAIQAIELRIKNGAQMSEAEQCVELAVQLLEQIQGTDEIIDLITECSLEQPNEFKIK